MSDLRKAAQAALDAYDEDEFIDSYHFRIMEALRAALAETPSVDALIAVDDLANIIRTVDGSHTLGAGELAEKIIDAIRARGGA